MSKPRRHGNKLGINLDLMSRLSKACLHAHVASSNHIEIQSLCKKKREQPKKKRQVMQSIVISNPKRR